MDSSLDTTPKAQEAEVKEAEKEKEGLDAQAETPENTKSEGDPAQEKPDASSGEKTEKQEETPKSDNSASDGSPKEPDTKSETGTEKVPEETPVKKSSPDEETSALKTVAASAKSDEPEETKEKADKPNRETADKEAENPEDNPDKEEEPQETELPNAKEVPEVKAPESESLGIEIQEAEKAPVARKIPEEMLKYADMEMVEKGSLSYEALNVRTDVGKADKTKLLSLVRVYPELVMPSGLFDLPVNTSKDHLAFKAYTTSQNSISNYMIFNTMIRCGMSGDLIKELFFRGGAKVIEPSDAYIFLGMFLASGNEFMLTLFEGDDPFPLSPDDIRSALSGYYQTHEDPIIQKSLDLAEEILDLRKAIEFDRQRYQDFYEARAMAEKAYAGQIEILTQTANDYRDQLQEARSDLKTSQEEVKKYLASGGANLEATNRLKVENDDLKKEVEHLDKELKELKEAPTSDVSEEMKARVQSLEEENAHLKAQNEELTHQAEELKAASQNSEKSNDTPDTENLKNKIKELERAVKEKEETLNERNETVKSLRNSLATAQNEAQASKEELEKMKDTGKETSGDTDSDKEKAQSELSKVKEEKDALAKQVAALENEKVTLSEKEKAALDAAEALKKEKAILAEERDKLKKENADLHSAADILRDKNNELTVRIGHLEGIDNEETQKALESIMSRQNEKIERILSTALKTGETLETIRQNQKEREQKILSALDTYGEISQAEKVSDQEHDLPENAHIKKDLLRLLEEDEPKPSGERPERPVKTREEKSGSVFFNRHRANAKKREAERVKMCRHILDSVLPSEEYSSEQFKLILRGVNLNLPPNCVLSMCDPSIPPEKLEILITSVLEDENKTFMDT